MSKFRGYSNEELVEQRICSADHATRVDECAQHRACGAFVWHTFRCGAASLSRLPTRNRQPILGLGKLACPVCLPDSKYKSRGLVVLYVRLPFGWHHAGANVARWLGRYSDA